MDNFTNGSLAIARHVVNCPSDADDTFGPVILASCRGGVDFTLLFEHTILSILPACIFLLWSALRIIQLRQSSSKTLSSSISLAKTVSDPREQRFYLILRRLRP